MHHVKVKKLSHFDNLLQLPSYQTQYAAGADISACLESRDKLVILPGQRVLVPTGLSFEIPNGFEIQVRPRSGLSFKTGLMVLNSPGTIDSDYRGEVKIILGNLGNREEVVYHGDRVAQIIFSPVYRASFVEDTKLSETARGNLGFGSTGVSRMDSVVAYKKINNRFEAYDTACKRITPEYIEGFRVSADIRYDKENTKLVAVGKNFELCIVFKDSNAEVDLKLPFMLKPLKGQVLAKIERELFEVL